MTDAEKLKQLIEIAWGNGWRLTENGRGNKPDLDDVKCILSGDIYNGIAVTVQEPVNSILFDHAFIKALCRAKCGSEQATRREMYGLIVNPSDPAWPSVIQELAVETDRIGYLWSEFGSTLPSS